MTAIDQPNPKFVEFLEWQLQAERRRQARFSRPPTARTRKYLATGALLICSALLGAGGMVAAQEIRGAKQRELAVKRAELFVQLAQRQFDRANAAAAQAERRFAAAETSRDPVVRARQQSDAAMARLSRARLDHEESQATGLPARDDLTAPQVGERDFVAERLRADAESARNALDHERELLTFAQTRYEAGQVTVAELEGGALRVNEAEAATSLVANLIELRRKFRAGEMAASDTQALELHIRSKHQLQLATLRHDAALKALEIARKRFAAGAVPREELTRFEAALDAAEVDFSAQQMEQQLLEGIDRK